MEFFLPGLFLFLVSLGITFLVAPKATPAMASILSIIFLTYGVYHHHKLFAAEYRLSTWQEGLKLYAPAAMILAVILFVLYGILAFFTSGEVPVPALPNVSLPSANSLTESITNSMESIGNSMTNTVNNVMSLGSNNNAKSGNNENKNKNKGNSLLTSIGNNLGLSGNKSSSGNNASRSFLETV
jgi:hypothetical protein